MAPPDFQSAPDLSGAMLHYREGRFAEADRICRALLAANPRDARALHLAGAAAAQQGRADDAVRLLRDAVAADATFVEGWLDLARLLEAYGRRADVLPCLIQLARLKSDAELSTRVGDELRNAGRTAESIEFFDKAIELAPQSAILYVRRCVAMIDLGRFADAEVSGRHAVRLAPDLALAHHALADALIQLDRLAEAIDAYRRSLALDPSSALTHTNLGVALQKAGRRDEAIAAYRAAIANNPDFALAYGNLGKALSESGQLNEAEHAARRAVALEPRSAIFRTNLASTLGDLNRTSEQLVVAREAIALDPNHVQSHVSAALALLKLGQMEEGWREFEWRTRGWETHPARRIWRGEALDGKRIVLRAEQAFGDVIQIIRYAALVKNSGGQVIVECQPLLKELLRHADGVSEVYAQGESFTADLEVWMMSLPAIFGTTVGTIPATVPYLHHDSNRVDQLRPFVNGEPRLKIGLIWSGNPAHLNDRVRSCPLKMLESAIHLPDVRCFSLQKGAAGERDAAMATKMGLVDLAGACDDFADTAAAMSLMDLILTVDTAPAHLAGALGRPTWTLLSPQADWRWMPPESHRSVWYPTMRLMRQSSPGDWAGLIATVVQALRDWPREPAQTSSRTITPR